MKVTLSTDEHLAMQLRKVTAPPQSHSLWGVSYRAAMYFFARLVVFGTDPNATNAKDCPKHVASSKYLCRFHGEGNTVTGAFEVADRIEATIAIRHKQTLFLEVNFYRVGEQDPFQQVHFGFSQADGALATSGGMTAN